MADTHPTLFQGPSAFQPRRSNDFERNEAVSVDKNVQNKFDLGPRWSSEEIQLFFETFRDCGKDWESILNELHTQGFTHRTKDHIKSLYSKHKTYLKLATASAQDLTAIMTDYYKSLNLEKQRQNQLKQNIQLQHQQHSLDSSGGPNGPKGDEFACDENIKSIKIPRRPSGGMVVRPGYSSSSEEVQNKNSQTSSDDQYQENTQTRFQKGFQQHQQPLNRGPSGVFRPQISNISFILFQIFLVKQQEEGSAFQRYNSGSGNTMNVFQGNNQTGFKNQAQQQQQQQQQQQNQVHQQQQNQNYDDTASDRAKGKSFNRNEQYGSRSAQNQHKYKSRQQHYHQFYPKGQRNERYPLQNASNQNQEMYDDNIQEGGQYIYDDQQEMDTHQQQHVTPSRQRKRTLYPGGMPSRRLFSQNTSPMRGAGQSQVGNSYGRGVLGPFKGQQNLKNGDKKDAKPRLTTQQKRQIKSSKQICRRGLQEMNPFFMIQDDSDQGQNVKQNVPPQSPVKYSKAVMRWMKCEYFYSWIDRPYFLNSDFKQLLAKADLENVKLNSLEWSIVRIAIAGATGKPRRFSDQFISDEKQKLNIYREIFREIIKAMQQKNFIPDQNGDLQMFHYDKKPQFEEEKVKEVVQLIRDYQIAPLVVSQRVLALHPKTKELRTASLLTTDVKSYHAQFDRPELGVIVINDLQLIPISGNEYYQQNQNQNSNMHLNKLRNLYLYNKFCKYTVFKNTLLENMIQRVHENNQGQIVTNQNLQNPFSMQNNLSLDEEEGNFIPFDHTQFSKDNIRAMALLIILFERKNRLISEIKFLNDQYARNPQYTEDFRQKYAWTAVQLQATNSIVEPVLTMFRYRQIKPEYLSLYENDGRFAAAINGTIDPKEQELLLKIHSCEKGEELINVEYFKRAQTLQEIDEYIEIKKDYSNSCQVFDNEVYQGIDNIDDEDSEMQDDLEIKQETSKEIDYDSPPNTAMIAQEIASSILTLQQYYKIMMPAHLPEESKLYQDELSKQKTSLQNNEQSQEKDQHDQQPQYFSLPQQLKANISALETIIQKCTHLNDEQLKGNLDTITDYVNSDEIQDTEQNINQIQINQNRVLLKQIQNELYILQQKLQSRVLNQIHEQDK